MVNLVYLGINLIHPERLCGNSISGSIGKFGEGFQGLEVVQGAEVWVAELLEQRQSPLVVSGPEGGGDLRLVLLLPSRRGGVGFGRGLCCGGTPLSLASLDSSP